MSQAGVAVLNPVTIWGDEYGMTFQVTLWGCDGLVVASDRMFVDDHYIPGPYREQRVRRNQRFAGTKFLLSDNGNVACAFAGGAQAKNMAEAIVAKCAAPLSINWESSIKSAIAGIRGTSDHVQDEVVIVFRGSRPLALRLSKIGDLDPSIITIQEHICTGDLSGTAHFLVTHLWRSDMTMGELQRLALLVLAFAAKENSYGIGEGAELLTVATGDFNIEEYRKEDLAELCAEFTESMRELFADIVKPKPVSV